jgi:hypothetical protein
MKRLENKPNTGLYRPKKTPVKPTPIQLVERIQLLPAIRTLKAAISQQLPR